MTLPERERRNHHRAAVIWLTGLSGAGKSTLARGVVRRLFDRGFSVATVDGDQLRWSLNTDLGFTEADRAENVRRSAAVAGVMAEAGHIVLVSVIAPFADARAAVRASARHPFYEVFVNAPLAVCEERDPKGLYRKARSGEITSFTGIDSPYEAPEAPDLEIRTDSGSIEDGIAKLIAFVEERTAPGRRRRLTPLLDDVLALARRAGDAILAVVAARAQATTFKADDSPVTAADLAADRVIAAGLAALDPATPVVSEEQERVRDGTLGALLAGRPARRHARVRARRRRLHGEHRAGRGRRAGAGRRARAGDRRQLRRGARRRRDAPGRWRRAAHRRAPRAATSWRWWRAARTAAKRCRHSWPRCRRTAWSPSAARSRSAWSRTAAPISTRGWARPRGGTPRPRTPWRSQPARRS